MGYINELRPLIGHRTIVMPCAVVIITDGRGNVLLQKRVDDGLWGYHGGAIEPDESVEDALRREVFEELHLTLDHVRYFATYSGERYHHVYPNGDEVSCIEMVYVCDSFHGDIQLQAEEVSEIGWFNRATLPENLTNSSREPLHDFFAQLSETKSTDYISQAETADHMTEIEPTDYALLASQTAAFAEEDPRMIPLLSNTAALLMDTLSCINWAGFYLADGEDLILGPFAGHPACIHIARGRGVCGTALATDTVQLVPDVHLFPGHIACDSASASEIVLPIHQSGKIVGVLDIDSPVKNRFTQKDAEGLLKLVNQLEAMCVFTAL